ncbi:serine/threonine protein kinase [Corallococcus sp. H22C18031201]|nr:serine/threonine protein kinase [Corallococcus sp. H22C18031201]
MTTSTADDLPRGTILRQTYEIESVLGRGGMGTVHLARHLRLPGKQVAIKVLHHSASLPADIPVRFRREAEIASRLAHPNIVEVLDFDTLEDGSPFMVMEYLRGESLSRRLRKQKRLPLQDTLVLAREMGSALQAAHRAGVVHRDLKPGNVFLIPTEAGGRVTVQVKLLDFGISKILDSQTVQTLDAVLMGTPQYMAPEQALGHNSSVDARTDLFAFGCIVYEMLAGRGPFAGDSVAELMYQIVHEPPADLSTLAPELPESVVAALLHALQKKPEDRPADASTFIAELTGTPLELRAPASPALRPITTPRAAPPSEPVAPAASPTPVTRDARPAAPSPASETPLLPPADRVRATARRRALPWVAAGVLGLIAAAAWLRSPGGDPATAGEPRVAPTAHGAGSPSAPVAPTPTGARAGPGENAHGNPAQPQTLQENPAQVALPGPERNEAPQANPSQPPQPETIEHEAPPAHPSQVAQPEPGTTNVPTGNPLQETPGVATRVEAPRVSTTPNSRPAAAERISEPVRQDLAAAEQALAADDIEGALRLIRMSQRKQVTGASYALIARVHCRQGDLANAKAQWSRIPSSERPRVKQYCRRYHIDL